MKNFLNIIIGILITFMFAWIVFGLFNLKKASETQNITRNEFMTLRKNVDNLLRFQEAIYDQSTVATTESIGLVNKREEEMLKEINEMKVRLEEMERILIVLYNRPVCAP